MNRFLLCSPSSCQFYTLYTCSDVLRYMLLRPSEAYNRFVGLYVNLDLPEKGTRKVYIINQNNMFIIYKYICIHIISLFFLPPVSLFCYALESGVLIYSLTGPQKSRPHLSTFGIQGNYVEVWIKYGPVFILNAVI
jgi:hypothetical protein